VRRRRRAYLMPTRLDRRRPVQQFDASLHNRAYIQQTHTHNVAGTSRVCADSSLGVFTMMMIMKCYAYHL